MRIGIDASRAFVGEPTGTERYSFEVITRLIALPEARRHEWIIYVRSNLKFEIRNLKLNSNCKVQIVNLPWLWTQVGLAYRTWVDKLDVLWVPAHTLPVWRRPGLKTVVTIHGIEYEWLPAYENFLQRWYLPLSTKYAVLAADKIIAVSQFTKNQLIERMGADESKIEVVYEGVNLKDPGSRIQDSGEVLKKYGLRPRQYLLFVGTVQPRKNLERLIQAFASLKSQVPSLKLVIAGKLGWSYGDILAAPRKFGVEGKVVFTGYVDDAERCSLLGKALAYVQPSITEGFGLPVLEAWAAGLPVVSSFGGALGEVVGDAGEVFDPMDVEDMRRALMRVVGSRKVREELVTKGKKRVGDFDWENAAVKTYNILTR